MDIKASDPQTFIVIIRYPLKALQATWGISDDDLEYDEAGSLRRRRPPRGSQSSHDRSRRINQPCSRRHQRKTPQPAREGEMMRTPPMVGMVSDTEYAAARLDKATHYITTITTPHEKIHASVGFESKWYVDVLADDILDIRFVTPDTLKWPHFTFNFITEAEFIFHFYRTISITVAGTNLLAVNCNHNSDNETGLTAFDYILNVDITAANSDTNLSGATELERTKTGSGRSIVGASSASRIEAILKQNTGYCMRFENKTNATKYVDWLLAWYEHTNRPTGT